MHEPGHDGPPLEPPTGGDPPSGGGGGRPENEPSDTTPAGAGRSSKIWIVALGVVTVLLLSAIAYAIGRTSSATRRAGDVAEQLPDRPASNAEPGAVLPEPAKLPAGPLDNSFKDPEGRFTVGYPKGWTRLKTTDADVPFVITPGGLTSVLVRVLGPFDASDLTDVKGFADGVVRTPGRQILGEQQITVNGAQGFYYLYAFRDSVSGRELVHAHYFLVKGNRLHILVFQTSSDRFEEIASTFDRIAESYQPADSPVPATPTTTG